MDDLISREKLKRKFCGHCEDYGKCEEECFDLRIINSMPTAEPELIRCKDCKWCVEHYDTRENAPYWVCKNWDGGTEADGFCHEAERRSDG